MSEHVVPRSVYIAIFLALMALTVATIWIAFFNLGQLNAVVALSIAVVKALLVVLYFMHLRYSSRLTKVFVAAGILWLMILILLTLSDYLTR